MPSTFFPVMGSFRMNAAKIIAQRGMLVVMMEASPGDVRLTPKMKHP